MKKVIIPILIIIVCLQIIPGIFKYQTYIYEKDKNEYDLAKASYDTLIAIQREKAVDSLIPVWITTHDTALRKVKKINKTPEYGELGHYKRTGRLECERKYNGKLICEPEKEWVIDDYYIASYKKDTVWTEGYINREAWQIEARKFANEQAKMIYPEFHAYDGHEFHYLLKTSPGTTGNNLLIFYIFANAICMAILIKIELNKFENELFGGIIAVLLIIFGMIIPTIFSVTWFID
jgi:hypothetical protein